MKSSKFVATIGILLLGGLAFYCSECLVRAQ